MGNNRYNMLRRLFGTRRTRRKVVQTFTKQARSIPYRQIARAHFRRYEGD